MRTPIPREDAVDRGVLVLTGAIALTGAGVRSGVWSLVGRCFAVQAAVANTRLWALAGPPPALDRDDETYSGSIRCFLRHTVMIAAMLGTVGLALTLFTAIELTIEAWMCCVAFLALMDAVISFGPDRLRRHVNSWLH